MPACGSCPFPGTGYCDFYAKGGGCGCGGRFQQSGGDCGCGGPILRGGGTRPSLSQTRKAVAPTTSSSWGRKRKGGYRATKRNLHYLKKWKRGESIGFTMTASLKAKGLIPRTSRKQKGKRVVSRKYKH